MLSVVGIYDGSKVYPIDEIPDHRKYKVIITFVEELDSIETDKLNMREFGIHNASFDFWNNPEEDIYQDYLNQL